MKIIFMGTPDFSVPCLNALYEAGHEIIGVFTQPDKPKNRGQKIQMPPVKEYALEHGFEVYQPLSLRKGDDAQTAFDTIQSKNPDVIVVVAYGQFLPKSILDIPKYKCVNVHASLLPRYRGAAPIQRCIINGETETGVTTMYMAEGIDCGDMLLKSETEITSEMTYGELHDILSAKGAELIVETLSLLEKGTLVPEAQDNSLTCYAPMLDKEMCRVDFSKPVKDVHNLIRGLSPSPCAYAVLGGKRLKIFTAEIVNRQSDGEIGTVSADNTLDINCGDGIIRLLSVQLEGGKRLNASDFLRGRKTVKGEILNG